MTDTLLNTEYEQSPSNRSGVKEAHIHTFIHIYIDIKGCAIAQAVIRRPPTAAAWIRSQVRLCGICGVQSGAGASFLQVLRFPLPVFIPPTAPHSSSSIIQGWYNRPNSG
jgi:hypothetical protein